MSGGRKTRKGLPARAQPVQLHPAQGQPGGQTIIQSMQAAYSGPLPPPATLRGFGEVIDGLDQRIVGWVEEESKHRRELERREMALYEKAVTTDGSLQGWGLAVQTVVLIGSGVLAWFALKGGFEAAGVAAIIAAIIAGLAALRGGGKTRKADEK